MGDVIMVTGVIRELKRQYGNNANIDVLTEQIEVFRNNPHIRNVYHTDIPPDISTYNKYINLDDVYENDSGNHYVDSYFYCAFGHTNFDKRVELFPNEEDCRVVDRDLADIDKFIVVHMRNWFWGAKNINPSVWLDIYAKLFEKTTNFKVICVGGATDFAVESHPLFIDARDKYNCRQLKYLCDNARAFVGIDSGPFQCAAASRTYIVGLLTHLLPERIMPFRGHLTSITTNEECRGCNDRQQRPVRQVVCQYGDYRCTKNFDTDKITQAILEQLI